MLLWKFQNRFYESFIVRVKGFYSTFYFKAKFKLRKVISVATVGDLKKIK